MDCGYDMTTCHVNVIVVYIPKQRHALQIANCIDSFDRQSVLSKTTTKNYFLGNL